MYTLVSTADPEASFEHIEAPVIPGDTLKWGTTGAGPAFVSLSFQPSGIYRHIS